MKKILVGNWKMALDSSQAVDLAKSVTTLADAEVVVCPSFLHLAQVKAALRHGVKLGAQNVSRETFGAYTGEVCAEQLRDIGCEYVIIGHSECRVNAKESNSDIKKKLEMASSAGLKPILCVGESLDEYKSGATAQIIEYQLDEALSGGGLL